MKEYKLRITSQNPVVISQDQFNALKDKDGRMKFGNVNEMVSLGGVGFNLKDVRGWEEVYLDEQPRGWESQQTNLNHEGIRKLRLVHAAINRRHLEVMGTAEQAEVAGIVRDWEVRKASTDYARRKLFDKLHYDVYFKTKEDREKEYKHWCKSTEALEIQVKELNDTADALFLSPTPPVEAELSSGESQVQRVKEILTEMNPDAGEVLEMPF